MSKNHAINHNNVFRYLLLCQRGQVLARFSKTGLNKNKHLQTSEQELARTEQDLARFHGKKKSFMPDFQVNSLKSINYQIMAQNLIAACRLRRAPQHAPLGHTHTA